MNEKPKLDPEERIFTLSDVKRFWRQHRKKLIRFGLVGAIGAFLLCGLRPAKYRIEATFKEGLEKSGKEALLGDLLGGLGSMSQQQPQAAIIMKSNCVLKPLIERTGLQVEILPPQWILGKLASRIFDNLKAEVQLPLRDIDSFVFQDVSYGGETKQLFYLVFQDADHFSVYLNKRTKLAEGERGKEVSFAGVTFRVMQTPKWMKVKRFYRLRISPWARVAKKLRSDLQVVSNKSQKQIYNLSYAVRDRKVGVRVLNELMEEYRRYLKKDHDELAVQQLAYLEDKQQRLYSKISDVLDEHVSYLSRNLEKTGFPGLEQESKSLFIPYQKMFAKLLTIDVELARLDQLAKGGIPISVAIEGPFAAGLKDVFEQIQTLQQQRDLLEISLQNHSPHQQVADQFTARQEELKSLRSQRSAVTQFLAEGTYFDLNQTLSQWAGQIEQLKSPLEKRDFTDYLENYARLLSVREKMLQEHFFSTTQTQPELEGIDLQTARNLFVDYNGKLDLAERAMRRYAQLKAEISNPDFDLASLSSVLTDPFSTSVIGQACKAALQLKDERYRSSRDEERWQQDLTLYRKTLSDHLEQLYKVEELQAALIREKVVGLQQVSLNCINRQMSVLHEQIKDAVKLRKSALTQEKALLEQKMLQMREDSSDLPEKWRSEKWLGLKAEMGQRMMEALTQLVEKKTIGHHLHHVESKPLDLAILPLLPKKPGLIPFIFLGAFGACFGTFFIQLLRAILKGFPVSPEKLEALRLPYLGSISAFCDGPSTEPPLGPDLELLRKLGLFIEKDVGKVVSLLCGAGPDYSYTLAENLARLSYKSILVRCDFTSPFRESDLPGLVQIWKGEITELPIRKGEGYDTLATGGYTPFGTELLQSRAFEQLIDRLKKNYDWVFLLLRSPLSSTESNTVLRICDKAVVTLSGEQMEQLTPFIDWGYHENRLRLYFIANAQYY